MSRLLWCIGWLWSLPNTLIGILLLVGYWPTAVWWDRGVLCFNVKRVIGYSTTAAQTWGQTVMYVDRYGGGVRRHPRHPLVRHERKHCEQGRRWGVFFLIAYPVASLMAMLRGGHGYYDNAFEIEARKAE